MTQLELQMINESVGNEIFKFRGLGGIRENHENSLPYGITTTVRHRHCIITITNYMLHHHIQYITITMIYI